MAEMMAAEAWAAAAAGEKVAAVVTVRPAAAVPRADWSHWKVPLPREKAIPEQANPVKAFPALANPVKASPVKAVPLKATFPREQVLRALSSPSYQTARSPAAGREYFPSMPGRLGGSPRSWRVAHHIPAWS